MPKIDVEIDSWFQDAVSYELKDYVRSKVKLEHNVGDFAHIDVADPEFSYGVIDVHWNCGLYPNQKVGCESFSLKEILKLISE